MKFQLPIALALSLALQYGAFAQDVASGAGKTVKETGHATVKGTKKLLTARQRQLMTPRVVPATWLKRPGTALKRASGLPVTESRKVRPKQRTC